MTNGKDTTTQTVQPIVPNVDIVETQNAYIVKLDIPGANKAGIKAQIENNTLTVSAPIADLFQEKEQAEAAREYRREFSLADDIDAATVNAVFELGVLTVTLNKRSQYLPKQITIN